MIVSEILLSEVLVPFVPYRTGVMSEQNATFDLG